MSERTGAELFEELDPSPRLLMGPGPVDVYPRVLRAMATPMLGQFDPEFRRYMDQIMALYRQLYRTKNTGQFLVDGTARAGIEACMTSLIAPGDKVLVPIFGRFGHLLTEIARRSRGEVVTIETEWGTVFSADQLEDAIKKHKPRHVAVVHGDTSTTQAQPLADLGRICRAHDVLLYVDATCTLGGMELDVDGWQLDAVSAGLQKCMSGPPGSSPITIGERAVEAVNWRKHIEGGIRPEGFVAANGPIIQSNYFDLTMLMDYWSPKGLNHHTEATSMAYAARECARVVLGEGLDACVARHRKASGALQGRPAGHGAGAVRRARDLAHRRHRHLHSVADQGRRGGAPAAAERFWHRDRHLVRPAARQDLADRHDGPCLPQAQHPALPRRAGSRLAAKRLLRAGRKSYRCGL